MISIDEYANRWFRLAWLPYLVRVQLGVGTVADDLSWVQES